MLTLGQNFTLIQCQICSDHTKPDQTWDNWYRLSYIPITLYEPIKGIMFTTDVPSSPQIYCVIACFNSVAYHHISGFTRNTNVEMSKFYKIGSFIGLWCGRSKYLQSACLYSLHTEWIQCRQIELGISFMFNCSYLSRGIALRYHYERSDDGSRPPARLFE